MTNLKRRMVIKDKNQDYLVIYQLDQPLVALSLGKMALAKTYSDLALSLDNHQLLQEVVCSAKPVFLEGILDLVEYLIIHLELEMDCLETQLVHLFSNLMDNQSLVKPVICFLQHNQVAFLDKGKMKMMVVEMKMLVMEVEAHLHSNQISKASEMLLSH